MDKKLTNKIIIGVLLVLALAGLFEFLFGFSQKQSLRNQLEHIKKQFSSLEKERQNLLQLLGKEKEDLNAADLKIRKLLSDLDEVRKDKYELNARYARLKAENKVLREKRQELVMEKENLKAKIDSIEELKKLIRELKIKMRLARRQTRIATEELERKYGNKGFLIKDGRSTHPIKVRIEVTKAR